MIKKLFTKKRIIWGSIFVIILAIIIIGASVNITKKGNELKVTNVKRGTLEQTISETGIVKKSDEIGLSFKAGGVIDAIYVEVGDMINRNGLLAKTDHSELDAQYQKAIASLRSAQAQLAQLLAGATTEEISLTETQVTNADVKLKNKKQSLENTRLSAENNLKKAYQDALNDLNGAYLDLGTAYLTIDNIDQSYFNVNDQEGIAVRKFKTNIKDARDKTKTYIDLALTNNTEKNIDAALSQAKVALDITYEALSSTRDICETILYRSVVTSTDKTSLDTQKSNINAERTNIIDAIQAIASIKIDNASAIDAARAQVAEYEGVLAEAEKNLAKLVAGPTKEEISLYEAKIAQAEADKSLLANQINQARLTSPIDGQVIRIKKRTGEIALAGEIIISLLSEKPFQVKTDIYEEDVGRLILGIPVNIELIAFPDLSISGNIASIDPIDKIVDGVVYYEVAIDFNEPVEGLRPGMSADIVIKTGSKDDVLIISESAVLKENDKLYVQVLEQNQKIKKEVRLGMKGGNGLIEVIKGLNEGEQIILP